MLHRLARYLAHKYEFAYHQPVGEFETAALEGAWKAACTFRQMRPEADGSAALGPDGVPVGLPHWGRIKIVGAIIDAARDEMRQHGHSRLERARKVTLSLDMPWDNDGERVLGDTLVDPRSDHYFTQVEDHEELLALRARLSKKEWDILTRYADGQTLKSIGEDVYGVTESRICQLMAKITDKCRRILAAMAEDVVVSPLTPMEREIYAEGTWLGVLAAGEEREAQRVERSRARRVDPLYAAHTRAAAQ
jgi:hypothetical protein